MIAGTAGGILIAAQTKTVVRDTTYTGPFGGSYRGAYAVTEHPNFALAWASRQA